MFEYIKIAHIVFVMSWFAGLVYLPRLFVYHATASDNIGIERFKIMERKLYRGIMTPTMVLALITGFGMLLSYPSWPAWLHAKISLVACLVIYHFYCGHLLKIFANDCNKKSHVFYRILNEVPLVFLIFIVFLVVAQPF